MSTTKNKLKQSFPYRFLRKLEQDLRKAAKKFSMLYRLKKAPPVFIYQMGKVASSSIHHSLKKQYPGPVAHAHHIGSDNWASELFYKWYRQGYTIKIISPIRDPIGYNISSFFQNFEKITGAPFSNSKYETKELIQLFLEKSDHDAPLHWFDNNLKKHFDIDVFGSDFPDDGYKIYRHNNIELLVFQISISDTDKENIIREFLGISKFTLHNRNISSKKSYHQDYHDFKQRLKLPDDYLLKMKNSRFFSHFYSAQEIDKILLKWK